MHSGKLVARAPIQSAAEAGHAFGYTDNTSPTSRRASLAFIRVPQ